MSTAVGIETRGGVFTPLLNEGAVVPAEVTEIFTTAEDNQPSIKIRVMAGNGLALGDYELRLEPAPRHVPQIAVTFRVEQTGAFRLLAKDAKGNAVPVSSPAGRA
ncbi:MAG TPA: Hsp70 family protein [Candidatus Limnocylindrales bacterium]|nr:Hsp70 family protein [Candidatus Limnocylindrales bacterium]